MNKYGHILVGGIVDINHNYGMFSIYLKKEPGYGGWTTGAYV